MADSQHTNTTRTSPWFWLLLLPALATGVFFRLYLVTDQILLDDEWHALSFSAAHSLGYVLTHFSYAGANIIPVNAYTRLLLVSCGWSEMMLVLPSLIAGIAALLVFPPALKRIFSARAVLFFAFLFSVSPLIIFYSRVSRPYSIYTLLGFLSILIFYEWARTGDKKFGIWFSVLGVICVYFHFVGIIFIFVPLGCAVWIKFIPRMKTLALNIALAIYPCRERIATYNALPAKSSCRPGFISRRQPRSMEALTNAKSPIPTHDEIRPSLAMLIGAGCAILIGLAVLLSAALIQRLPAPHLSPAHFTMQSLLGFMQILSGTSHVLLNLLFYSLLCIGLRTLFRKSFLLGFIFVSLAGAYLFVSIVTKSNFAHVPLVLARYVMPLFPFAYLLVALGMDDLWRRAETMPVKPNIRNALCWGASFCFLAGLVWTGPLRQTYAAPNNFTHHSAFQESYAPIDWASPRISEMIERPYAVSRDHLPGFYHDLSRQPDVKKIIEYPMLLGNHFNLFYYYQRFHKKSVAVGYTRAVKDKPDLETGGILGNMIIDQVFSQVQDPGRLKFRNMVDILDMATVKNSDADLVIFHKNPESEILEGQNSDDEINAPLVVAISSVYRKIFGKPVFEDRHLVVFNVRDAETK